VPWARAADLSAASGGLTTLDQTIVKGSKLADGTLGSYYRLTFGAGEPHLPRTDLHPASYAPIHCAMSFVHFTDSHLVDAQSPGRVEFLDRYSEQQCGTLPFDAAFRPHEALALQVQEAMIRAIRRIRVGPATGKPFKFVIATGDNTDNEQFKDQTFGNHDGLMQGNAPRNAALAAVATGPLKFDGPPPGLNLCDPFTGLGTTYLPTHLVTADADRRNIRRNEYIEQLFHTTGTPVGHGFTEANRTSPEEIVYYVQDQAVFRFISLDTVNPGGYSDGSIGQKQFDWLTARLIEVHSRYYDASGNEVTTGPPRHPQPEQPAAGPEPGRPRVERPATVDERSGRGAGPPLPERHRVGRRSHPRQRHHADAGPERADRGVLGHRDGGAHRLDLAELDRGDRASNGRRAVDHLLDGRSRLASGPGRAGGPRQAGLDQPRALRQRPAVRVRLQGSGAAVRPQRGAVPPSAGLGERARCAVGLTGSRRPGPR
jgi:hypothetical protein